MFFWYDCGLLVFIYERLRWRFLIIATRAEYCAIWFFLVTCFWEIVALKLTYMRYLSSVEVILGISCIYNRSLGYVLASYLWNANFNTVLFCDYSGSRERNLILRWGVSRRRYSCRTLDFAVEVTCEGWSSFAVLARYSKSDLPLELSSGATHLLNAIEISIGAVRPCLVILAFHLLIGIHSVVYRLYLLAQ